MGKEIDSAALTELNQVLGLAGSGGAPRTELEDGAVNLVLEILPIVRRSRAIPPSEGIFPILFLFTHAAANDQIRSIDPYAPGTNAYPPYPGTVPDGFDYWVTGCGGRVSLAANFTNCVFATIVNGSNVGIGLDQVGNMLGVGARYMPLASFNDAANLGGSDYLTSEGLAYQHIGRRIRRGDLLSFASTSSGVLDIYFMVMGCLLPSGLGQDAIT